jgi:hypothetical protein
MNVDLIRRIGAAILAVAVVAVWFTMKPNVPPTRNFASDLRTALADNRSNEATDTTVYQQQVTSAWLSNHLLEIVIKQSDAHSRLAAPSDRRIPAELVLLTLGIALFMGTALTAHRPVAVPATTAAGTADGWPEPVSGAPWGTTLMPPASGPPTASQGLA